MKKKFSLRLQLIFIMIAFVAIILGIIYFCQTNFLETYYKNEKIEIIEEINQDVSKSIQNGESGDLFQDFGMNNEVCIRVVSNDENYNHTGACALSNLDNEEINEIAYETYLDGGTHLFEVYTYQSRERMKDNNIYIYSSIIDVDDIQVMVLVSSMITPLDATISTIKSEYKIIVLIVILTTILLALILSFFIIRPINKINEESKNLAKGKYDGNLIRTSSLEIDDLNNTLVNANEDILKADKAKKELLGNVSHDLRTPLTMIVGYGEMMKEIPEEKNDDNLNVIIDEAKRLSTLVDDLLLVSKLEANQVELHESEILLSDLLNSVYHQYEKYCESMKVNLQIKVEVDGMIRVDVDRMKQVLYNFINNSLNYANKENSTIILGSENKEGLARIYVYDNGEGIAPENIDKIWDRYFKVDKEHKRSHIGSGIGLSLCQQLLEAHHLKYGVESNLGEYTKFYFDIDLKH